MIQLYFTRIWLNLHSTARCPRLQRNQWMWEVHNLASPSGWLYHHHGVWDLWSHIINHQIQQQNCTSLHLFAARFMKLTKWWWNTVLHTCAVVIVVSAPLLLASVSVSTFCRNEFSTCYECLLIQVTDRIGNVFFDTGYLCMLSRTWQGWLTYIKEIIEM
jgi:hypothetical protein